MKLFVLVSRVRRLRVLGYALAALLSVLALWLRLKMGTAFEGYPFLTFFAAVLITSLFGGIGPGMMAALLSGLLAQFFLIEPVNTFALLWPSGWIAMAFFAVTTLLMVALVNGMAMAYEGQLRHQDRLEELSRSLEARVAERTARLENEIKERAAAEAQVRQLQKMEAIGQLTGGIAHDFNNMLAIVIGSLDLAKSRLTGLEHERVVKCIDNAQEGAQRAALLTARLLAFSRQQPLAPQAADANKLVSGMSEMLRRTLGDHIKVETILAGGMWHCFADVSQLENAIVNLAINARDAMPDGGKLTIETANIELDDRYSRQHEDVDAGQYVMVCVSDSGTGMPAAVIERAFDPFYTTKGVGKGTGLGLSQVYGFVKQSGGHVKIYSELGEGTAVKLYLPRFLGAVEGASTVVEQEALPRGAREMIILVVEDEDQVRHMTVDALRDLGYTVVQATGPNQALEQLEVQPHIDFLFTDIVMPDMSGRVLAEKARSMRAEIKVLYTTGYTRNAVVHNGMLDPGVAFLPKPFTLEQLALKVRDVLSGKGANR
jgi:signal transduction histidine kinase/ActR/RegA family two-component response regulator